MNSAYCVAPLGASTARTAQSGEASRQGKGRGQAASGASVRSRGESLFCRICLALSTVLMTKNAGPNISCSPGELGEGERLGWVGSSSAGQRSGTPRKARRQHRAISTWRRQGGCRCSAAHGHPPRPRPQSSPCRGRNPGQNPSKQRSTEGRGCVAAHSVPPCSALSVAASQTEDAASRIAAA